jgi:Rhodopirellula transposase DDE domain
MVIGAAVEKE